MLKRLYTFFVAAVPQLLLHIIFRHKNALRLCRKILKESAFFGIFRFLSWFFHSNENISASHEISYLLAAFTDQFSLARLSFFFLIFASQPYRSSPGWIDFSFASRSGREHRLIQNLKRNKSLYKNQKCRSCSWSSKKGQTQRWICVKCMIHFIFSVATMLQLLLCMWICRTKKPLRHKEVPIQLSCL